MGVVLTRKIDESIYIGDDIKIMIVSIEANQVRIKIDAPKEILILREELYKKPE